MRIHFSLFLLLFIPFLSFSQLNMTLQDSVTYTVGVNDVNGWVAPDGKEYALVGLNTGVAIVDINEDTLKEVAFVAGVNNLWRDINTYGHYAYVSSEAHVGLLIIDLQYLPDSVQTFVWQDSLPTENGPKPFEKAHTLWTDEHGLLYLNGSNLNNGGVIMLDITTNPIDPIFLGYAPNIYSHDCYSRDSIIYSAEIYGGNLSIYDAHDPQNITLIGRVKTPYEFTHNAWLSDNSQFMFTTDERPNSYVTSYDISDPSNIIELDRYRQAATDGRGNVGHNVYVWNDWLVVAYYANGTVIVDASRPDNLVEVGNFDSYLGDGGFPGVWGSYPWLPSGKILTSDRNSGLYVFIPNYVHACFLEGTVVDSITGDPINNAVVTIVSDEIVFPESTKPNGEFKMGKAVPGQFNITATKDGYYPKTFTAQFNNGEVLAPVIKLVQIPTYAITGQVTDEGGNPVKNAEIVIHRNGQEYRTVSAQGGFFAFPSVLEGLYEIQAGVWGFTYEEQVNLSSPVNMTLVIKRGYKDDFDLDLGWSYEVGNALNGSWIREIPQEQLLYDQYPCGSQGDSPNDSGYYAFSTGNSNSTDVLDSEVNGGTTWLGSPAMNLAPIGNAAISFDYWLCEFPPNQYDGVYLWITNGVDTFLLDELRNDTIAGSWQTKLYDSLQIAPPLNQVRLLISASDTTTGTNTFVLKMHFDNFQVIGDYPTGTKDLTSDVPSFLLYPNPLSGSKLYLKPSFELKGNEITIEITDLQGRSVYQVQMEKQGLEKGMNVQIPDGIYFVQWHTNMNESGVAKLMVLKN